MKQAVIYLLVVYVCIADKKYFTNGRSQDDDYLRYSVEDLHRVQDWRCWYKDYYLKVPHCLSRTIKSPEKMKCKGFRTCRRKCRNVYGLYQCKVNCRLESKAIAKFIKVVYKIKDKNGLCKDSVVCVYQSKCNGRWTSYQQRGCYFMDEFYPWWIEHEKEYIRPKFSGKLFMETERRIYDCVHSRNHFGFVDPSLERTIKIGMDHGKTFHEMGDLKIKTKCANETMWYFVGDRWLPVKFEYNHPYLKLRDKWVRFVVWRKRFYVHLHGVWAPLKISFGKIHIRLGKRWLTLRIEKNRLYHKVTMKWFELRLFNTKDLYSKIGKVWFKIKFQRYTNLIKLGAHFQKVKELDNKLYIRLGSRWFRLSLTANKSFIKLDSTCYEVEFEEDVTFIHIDKFKYPIEFRAFDIYIQVNGGWFQMEPYYEYLFFKINKYWINLSLQNNNFSLRKNKSLVRLTMDKKKNLFYKMPKSNKLKSLLKMDIDHKSIFDQDKFLKSQSRLTLKLIGGHWLPFKVSQGNTSYLISEKWMRLRTQGGKMFYKDFNSWFEICLIGKAEFVKIHGVWMKIKRKADQLFFFDTGRWHQIKISGRRVFLRINKSWKPLAFDREKKFIRLGNKYLQLKFHEIHDSIFYLYLGRKWFQIMIQYGNYCIKLNGDCRRMEFPLHRSIKILFDKKTWISATFKENGVYIQNGRCWLEVYLEKKKPLVKIGDTWTELEISSQQTFNVNISGKLYKLTGKNGIKVNNTKTKVTFIDGQLHAGFDDDWLPLRIIKESFHVKIVDSWVQGRMSKDGRNMSITIDKEDILLTFENGVLCEKYGKINVPISVRFGRLYYNLDNRWVKVYPQNRFRYLKINQKLKKINEDYLREKIKIYKRLLMKRCLRSSLKRRYKNYFKFRYGQRYLNKEIRRRYRDKGVYRGSQHGGGNLIYGRRTYGKYSDKQRRSKELRRVKKNQVK